MKMSVDDSLTGLDNLTPEELRHELIRRAEDRKKRYERLLREGDGKNTSLAKRAEANQMHLEKLKQEENDDTGTTEEGT